MAFALLLLTIFLILLLLLCNSELQQLPAPLFRRVPVRVFDSHFYSKDLKMEEIVECSLLFGS